MEIIDSQKFRAKAKSSLEGGYLFFGEEEYLKHSCLEIARKSVLGDMVGDTFNHIKIDAEERSFDLADIENAILALPAFSDRKLVEIHNLWLDKLREKEISELCEIFSLLSENSETVLILYCAPHELEVEQRRPSALFKALSEQLVPVSFEKQSREKLAKWISAHFTHNKVKCSPDTCYALIDTCGSDMFALASEVQKLSSYVLADSRDTLSYADIELMTPKNREVGEFDLSNAILARNRDKVFFILSKYELEDKSGTEVGFLLGSIIRIFSLQYRISLLAGKGMGDRDIAKELKMNEYQCSLYRKNLGRRSSAELERILALCAEADALIKGGAQKGYVVLSRLLCEAML